MNESDEDIEFVKEIINNNELANMSKSRPVYEWLTYDNKIDLYKCCKLCILSKNTQNINKFFCDYDIYVSFTVIEVLNEYALEFFRGHEIPFNRIFYMDYAYYSHLFENFDINNFDYYAYNDVLTKEKAEFIINLRSAEYPRRESDETKRLEFVNKCKLLGIDGYKLRKEFSISYDEYEILSEEYCNFKKLTYEEYKKLTAVNNACITYVKTLVEIADDLDQPDMIISADSAKKLLEFSML